MEPQPFDFADLLAPFGEQRFLHEHYGRKPLVVRHDAETPLSARTGLMSLARLGEMLNEPARWTQDSIKLVMSGRGVDPTHFMVSREFAQGNATRPDAAPIETLMGVGATLVIDGMEDQDGALRRMCQALGHRFGGKATVNLYASRRGVQGFASHCDPHEVFAVHCEGEKTWRIYEGAEDAPVESTLARDAAYIERTKGKIAMEVTLRPGDLLYIPRGVYHDALASTERSLHLTFGVQPLYGVVVLDLLREMALSDRVMREYLAPAQDTAALRAQLATIATVLAEMVDTPGMLEDIAVRQRTLASPTPAEPGPVPTEYFARTALACSVDQPLSGSVLHFGARQVPAGLISDAARWAFAQASFSWPQFAARFCHHPAAELQTFIDQAVSLGAFERRPMA
jgi:ribosomal protein L16 Arg81 hydroxylase